MNKGSDLRRGISDIFLGYSSFLYNNQKIFVKHLSNKDLANIDHVYELNYEKAISRGINTEVQQLEFLKKSGLWTSEEESDYLTQIEYLNGLKKNLKNAYLIDQINYQKQEIDRVTKLVREIEHKRNELIGLTAEKFANKQYGNYYVFCSLHKSSDLNTPLYTEQEFDEISQNTINELILCYNNIHNLFSTNNLKKMALSLDMQNLLSLSTDSNPYFFYGKPIVELTVLQISLYSYGLYYKNILSEHTNLDEELLNDPDKLEQHINLSKNAQKIINRNNSESGGRSIVGAKKEDYKNMGIDDSDTIDLAKLAQEKGQLSMMDMIKLHQK